MSETKLLSKESLIKRLNNLKVYLNSLYLNEKINENKYKRILKAIDDIIDILKSDNPEPNVIILDEGTTGYGLK